MFRRKKRLQMVRIGFKLYVQYNIECDVLQT